ncbi:MAG: hypothetical protein LAO79_20550 [Acidobacteriia bacterium]|nr:hypothetical protein [Terriglobia bacterium]
MKLVDSIELPVILHSEAASCSADELAGLRARGILRPPSKADRIPRPKRFGPGPDVDVHDGPAGQVGVVEDDDYHYEPIFLTDEDTWEYPISLPHLVDAIRRDNGIDGAHFRNDNGLISVGQRSVAGVGLVGVYLSLPNGSEDSVMARCRRLIPIVGERWIALLTPRILDLSREDLGILTTSRIVTISLMAAAGKGHFAVNWDEAFGHAARDAGAFASAGTAKGVEPDLERLIEGKQSVGIATAARYLERSSGQVERLVRDGVLKRVGQGRPTQVSTASLRTRKGTQEEPDS